MENRVRINDEMTVGGQPTSEEIRQLAQEGVRTVINLRVSNEDENMPSPLDEGDLVRELGMTYLHLPVSTKQIRPEQVDEYRNAVEQLDGPVFTHCASAGRAGAFAILHEASRQGWTGKEALAKARELGLPCNKQELVDLVSDYADRQHTSS